MEGLQEQILAKQDSFPLAFFLIKKKKQLRHVMSFYMSGLFSSVIPHYYTYYIDG